MENAGLGNNAAEGRWLAAWEIVAAGTSALIAEWCVSALAGGGAAALMFPVLTAVAFMLVSHRARRESLRDVGWRLDNFLEAARLLAPVMLAVTAALVAAGWYASTLDFRRWEGGQS